MDGGKGLAFSFQWALKNLASYTKITDTAFLREYHRKIILPRLSQTPCARPRGDRVYSGRQRKGNPAVAKFKAESFYDSTFIDELRAGRGTDQPYTELNLTAPMTGAGIGFEPGFEKDFLVEEDVANWGHWIQLPRLSHNRALAGMGLKLVLQTAERQDTRLDL